MCWPIVRDVITATQHEFVSGCSPAQQRRQQAEHAERHQTSGHGGRHGAKKGAKGGGQKVGKAAGEMLFLSFILVLIIGGFWLEVSDQRFSVIIIGELRG